MDMVPKSIADFWKSRARKYCEEIYDAEWEMVELRCEIMKLIADVAELKNVPQKDTTPVKQDATGE